MIESISMAGIATYDNNIPESLKDLSKINFLYGSNGTGKTTIMLGMIMSFAQYEREFSSERVRDKLMLRKNWECGWVA